MPDKQATDRVRRRWALLLALFCALLLFFGATVQAAHVHTPADVSHSGCALCATAHVVIAPAAPLSVSVPASETATAVLHAEPAWARRLLDVSLYTRPPPVAIAFS